MTDATTPSGRRVQWVELFFDLVIVAYIGQIAHIMHGDPSWTNAVAFVGFLAAAWWAWVNATITLSLFGERITPLIWASVAIAMVAIGVMAAAVPDALGNRAAAFAIGNALLRIIWAVPWFIHRQSVGNPWWRSVLYSVVPASLWLVSIVVAPPWQYGIWATAVAIEIVLLSLLGGQLSRLRNVLDVSHLAERVSLLVVIVFGESILTIIAELDGHWALPSGFAAVLGFAAVSMLAWIYFSYAASSVESGLQRLQRRGSIGGIRDTVMYLPFLLVAGVTLFASALGTAVADPGSNLPFGAVISLSAGTSLFFAASAAESLRYGASWGSMTLWAPAGILLPWALLPLSMHVASETVVAAAGGVVAVLLALSAVSARRARSQVAADEAARSGR